MASDYSFDIMAQIDFVEVKNAIEQAKKEISQRYDFKGANIEIDLNQKDSKLSITADDNHKLEAAKEIVLTRMASRKVPVKAFAFGSIESALNQSVRQHATIQQGIPQDKGKEMVKFIKTLGFKKIQASIQHDTVRVSGKDKDELQSVMGSLKDHDFGVFIDFGNYR